MARLTKQQSKLHKQAMDLIESDRRLTSDEIEFVFRNYCESVDTDVSRAGAFFTPVDLALDFRLDSACNGDMIDLCAGIGVLTWAHVCQESNRRHVCVEQNHRFVEIGKRLLPEVEWICADVFDEEWQENVGRFELAMSNPPFGRIKTGDYSGAYDGPEFEYKVIELASRLAKFGAFILPQNSAPFRYSGQQCYREELEPKYLKFHEQTGIELVTGVGIDTSIYRRDWKNTNITVEIVTAEFGD